MLVLVALQNYLPSDFTFVYRDYCSYTFNDSFDGVNMGIADDFPTYFHISLRCSTRCRLAAQLLIHRDYFVNMNRTNGKE